MKRSVTGELKLPEAETNTSGVHVVVKQEDPVDSSLEVETPHPAENAEANFKNEIPDFKLENITIKEEAIDCQQLEDIVRDISQEEVQKKRLSPSPTPSTSSKKGVKEKKSCKTIDDVIQLTLDTLQREEKVSDSFGHLVHEKTANLNIDQKELAEQLILNILRLARQEKLTSDHQILAIAPVNAHF